MDASYYKKYEPVFGAWKIKKKLGEGNFGAVFEIEREDFGTTYHAALKAITIPKNQAELDSIMDDGMDASATQKYLEQFVEKIVGEFVLMSKLKGNSNVVSYEDHQVIKHKDGVGWDILIRMELLTPMMSHIKTTAMTRRDVIKLGIDMCRALELCQKYNIIHRDIKPENIFISDSGDYKLGDFGIAKEVEKTQSGLTKTGTPTYMAPEVYKGQPYGSSVDIYSLGVVLYRLLNHNRAPFMPQYPNPISYKDKEKAFVMRVSGQKFPMPTNAGSGRLAEIAMKACSYKPEDRYSSPTQMREDLEAILYTEGEGTIMFPGGDNVEVKSIAYVSDGKRDKQVSADDLTEYIDDDATELLPTTAMERKAKITAFAKKKKGLISLVACLCAVIIGSVALFALRNDAPVVDDNIPVSGTETELEDPVEFSMDVLHMNESDFNLIVKRLDTYGVQYTANKDTKTFAVSRQDLGTTEGEVAASIEMITGVGYLMFSDVDATSENSVVRTDIADAYIDKDASQFVIELNTSGKDKLNLLMDGMVDSDRSNLSVFIDGKERCHAVVDQNNNIVMDIPSDIINDEEINLFSITASAAEIETSDNFVKLILSVIVNGEMTKKYDIYIDEKYGVSVEEAEPVEENVNNDDTGKNQTTNNNPDEKKPQSDVTLKPQSACNVCGSTWHTVHPTCSTCGSITHTVHPTCPTCGSTEHTTHPADTTPPMTTDNAGMPEVYIDFD